MTLRHLISPEDRRKRLQELLKKGNILRGMEVHNALSGLIVNDLAVESSKNSINQKKEFDFFWESSLTDSASKGHPDIEIISFDSRLRTISEILEVTDKPIVVDGDTGGDIHHFEYLIPKLERLGVSAVIIEDKVFPKRNSLEEGTNQDQEDPDKFSEKIKTGKKIQKSGDFMIIARIESLIAGKSVEEALFRAKKYLLAGADGIVIHSKSPSPDEIFEFAAKYDLLCKELGIKKPLVCIPTTYNSVYESELESKGFNAAIYGNHMLRASFKAMEDVGKIILESGRSLEADPYLASTKEVFAKVGFLDVKEKDKLMSTKPSVIIPAAGENPELKHILGNLPKPLLEIYGKSILEHQIATFKKIGLNDINIVIGYQKDKFKIPGVNYFESPEYSTTGMMHSLMKAKEKMKNGFILLSSDTLLDERLIKELLERKEDIVIIVDNSYLYHKHEIDKRLDAVITKKGKTQCYPRLRSCNDELVLIGRSIPKDLMTHESAGVIKFSKEGAENFIKVYEDCRESRKGMFHESECFDKALDIDMMKEMLDRGFKISVHETNGGWLEIHNERDIEHARHMIEGL